MPGILAQPPRGASRINDASRSGLRRRPFGGYVPGFTVGCLPLVAAVAVVAQAQVLVVFESVVVAAEGFEVVGVGWSAAGVGAAVVGVAGGGGSAAVGGAAGQIAQADVAQVGGAGSAADRAGVEELPVFVGEAVLPGGGVGLVEGDVAGDLGQDGSPAGDQGGVLVEAEQGGQAHAEVDHAAPVGGSHPAAAAAHPRVQRLAGRVRACCGGLGSVVDGGDAQAGLGVVDG